MSEAKILSLEEMVQEAAKQVAKADLSRSNTKVLIRFRDAVRKEQAAEIIGVLLSGYYSTRVHEVPYKDLQNLGIDKYPFERLQRKQNPDEVSCVLMSDFPVPHHSVKRPHPKIRHLFICYFNTVPRNSQPDFEYMLGFFRRDNNFTYPKFTPDRSLSQQEASGFRDYLSKLLSHPVPPTHQQHR